MNCSNDETPCKGRFFKIALMAIAGIAALGGVVMLLWNWLVPELFHGVPPISYVQALGVLLLSKILFGGFRGGCHRSYRKERWESMTPEERAQMKSRFKSRWGNWCGSRKSDGDASKEDSPSLAE